MPAERYGHRQYFSAPFVFIPVPSGPPRPRTHVQRYAKPFPGFRPVGGNVPNQAPSPIEAGRREGSRSPSTEYEFDEGEEISPVRHGEEGDQSEEGLFVSEESPVRQQAGRGSLGEKGLFVPELYGVDMAAALAWEDDE
jgi:hypothetical protein